jgi:hypothetical protein
VTPRLTCGYRPEADPNAGAFIYPIWDGESVKIGKSDQHPVEMGIE